ncbi:MAG: patatin-like phospholipase family protein [Solirubrobacterales bacterium]|nr:patatin-like phospholipase family protein [Solirubrobacterales bacterium]
MSANPSRATHPVIELLARRAAAASEPGRRTDGYRLALVLEGGGMRGVISAGMAAALERLGLTACFDYVVGTSAGALNGAAMIASVAQACCAAYHSAFASRRFINPYRLLIGRAAVDVAFTLDHAGEGLDAGRHDRAVNSRIPLHCVATDVDRAAPAVLSDLRSLPELRGALLASSRMPWVGGEPVPFRGRRFLDGGLAESIPHRSAMALGATHVLVAQTRPCGVSVEPASPLAERIIARRLRALNPALLELYRARPVQYERAVAEIAAATQSPPADGPFVYGLRLPASTPVISRLERRGAVLEAAGRAAWEHTERVLRAALGDHPASVAAQPPRDRQGRIA